MHPRQNSLNGSTTLSACLLITQWPLSMAFVLEWCYDQVQVTGFEYKWGHKISKFNYILVIHSYTLQRCNEHNAYNVNIKLIPFEIWLIHKPAYSFRFITLEKYFYNQTSGDDYLRPFYTHRTRTSTMFVKTERQNAFSCFSASQEEGSCRFSTDFNYTPKEILQ